MRTQRLACHSILATTFLFAGLLATAPVQAQRAFVPEGGSQMDPDPPSRSIIRGRTSTPRVINGPADGASSNGTSSNSRTANRSATTTRTRQAPELLPDRADEAVPRGTRSRSVLPEPRDDGSPIPRGYAVDPDSGDLVSQPLHPDDYFDHVDCPICGGEGCELCRGPRLGMLGGVYLRGEYLAWNMSGMRLPPLVTTSPNGTARAQAGVLGTNGVQVLFGDTGVNDLVRSGGRITLGAWLDDSRRNALEIDYFAIDDGNASFSATSSGAPILGRPFFNMLSGRETAELVAFPGVITGNVTVDTLTRFMGGGVRLRRVLCCGEDCGPSFFSPVPQPGAYRYELLLGYRTVSLDDQLNVSEDLTAITPPGTFMVRDSFQTTNEFHGFDLGMAMQLRRGRWTVDMQSRVAFGNNHSTVSIRGNTQTNDGGVVNSYNGGLLAQRTNIGDYANDQFAVIPEIGLNLGFDVTPNIRVFVGYSLLYWSRVVRAGDQISLDVNPNLIPPEAFPFTGPLRPQFHLVDTDFWAYGVNVGAEVRF